MALQEQVELVVQLERAALVAQKVKAVFFGSRVGASPLVEPEAHQELATVMVEAVLAVVVCGMMTAATTTARETGGVLEAVAAGVRADPRGIPVTEAMGPRDALDLTVVVVVEAPAPISMMVCGG